MLQQISLMLQPFLEQINSVEITTGSAVFRLGLSLLLGCCVGFERKTRGQIAGMRTFALISLGATLAMILSIYVPQEYLGLKNGDPGRIAAQVITGIGFLGAGAIIQMKGSVRGLTTAAGIWMVATIGMAVGVGLYLVSIVATALILVILVLLERMEHHIHLGATSRTLRLSVNGIVKSIEPYREALAEKGVHLVNFYVEYDFTQDRTVLNLVVLLKDNTDLISLFGALRMIHDTRTIALANQTSI